MRVTITGDKLPRILGVLEEFCRNKGLEIRVGGDRPKSRQADHDALTPFRTLVTPINVQER